MSPHACCQNKIDSHPDPVISNLAPTTHASTTQHLAVMRACPASPPGPSEAKDSKHVVYGCCPRRHTTSASTGQASTILCPRKPGAAATSCGRRAAAAVRPSPAQMTTEATIAALLSCVAVRPLPPHPGGHWDLASCSAAARPRGRGKTGLPSPRAWLAPSAPSPAHPVHKFLPYPSSLLAPAKSTQLWARRWADDSLGGAKTSVARWRPRAAEGRLSCWQALFLRGARGPLPPRDAAATDGLKWWQQIPSFLQCPLLVGLTDSSLPRLRQPPASDSGAGGYSEDERPEREGGVVRGRREDRGSSQ
jgi:hypothetical protein